MELSHEYERELERHYSSVWGQKSAQHTFGPRPAIPQPQPCQVFEFAPSDKTFCWIYATCGMTPLIDSTMVELFLMSPCQTEKHTELLTAISHFHQTGARLGLGHTVNFGRPWLDGSRCDFGLLSLPYPFGPSLENAEIGGKQVQVLWLIPITADERSFKMASGLEAMEHIFEKQGFNYLDPMRGSVVQA